MKKILSFVLALAMVLGCVSMVAIADGGTTNPGYKITAKKNVTVGQNLSTTMAVGAQAEVFTSADWDGTTLSVSKVFTVVNPNNHDIQIQAYMFGNTSGTVSKANGANNAIHTIPKNGSKDVTIKFTVDSTGKAVLVDGSTIEPEKLFLRVGLKNTAGYQLLKDEYFIIEMDSLKNGAAWEENAYVSFEAVGQPAATPTETTTATSTATSTTTATSTATSTATATPDPNTVHAGYKFTAINPVNATTAFYSQRGATVKAGIFTSADWDGTSTTIVKTFTITNHTNHEIKTQTYMMGYKADGSSTYVDGKDTGRKTFTAGQTREITVKVNVDANGKAKIDASDEVVDLENLYVRIGIVSGSNFAAGEYFTVEMPELQNGVQWEDSADFTIEAYRKAKPSPTPVATPTPVVTPAPTPDGKVIGAKFVEKSSKTTQYNLCNWSAIGKYMSDDPTFNGTITHSYRVFNTSNTKLTVELLFNNNKGVGANTFEGKVKVVIEPGKYKDMTISTPFVNGVTTLDAAQGATATLSQLRIRFNVKFAEANKNAGNEFIVASLTEDENDWFIKNYVNEPEFVKTMLGKADLPKVEAPKIPSGMSVTALQDTAFNNAYFITSTSGGIASQKDVQGNKLIKTVKVQNNNDFDIMIKMELQALVKVDRQNSWRTPEGAETSTFVTIEAGETGEVTFECETFDGKVIVMEEELPITSLFARFTLKNDGVVVEEGTKVTVFFGEEYARGFETLSDSTRWDYELVYTAGGAGTGDALPVALIATVAFAAIVLVVVSKKRKED
ncbi:MAG: hypothetical protein E7365_02600 [Clostridiales bacterium]|nr:hypothetical protein [Clostridiales bacterium]